MVNYVFIAGVIFAFVSTFALPVCYAECYANTTGLNLCPEGWVEHGLYCYKFESRIKLTRAEASTKCQSYYGTLVRIGDLSQHNFFNNYLLTNVVNASMHWYTSGIMDPANFGQYIWQNHATVAQIFISEINSLWHMKDQLPKPIQQASWPKGQIYVTYGSNGRNYGFYLENGTVNRPFICEIKKADVAKVGIITRTVTYGVNDLTNVPKAPCFTIEPKDYIYYLKDRTVQTGNFKQSIKPGENIAKFQCKAVGNPRPTYQWYIVDTTVSPAKRTLINPLAAIYGGRFSITDGTLVINFPVVTDPTGEKRYQCQASNIHGTILSSQAALSFGEMARFSNVPRTPERVNINKMAALSCDPPSKMKPKKLMSFNFLKILKNGDQVAIRSKERPMVFPSQSGVLYFSAVTMEDNGTYICNVAMKGATGGSAQTSPPMTLLVKDDVPTDQETKMRTGFPMIIPTDPFRLETVRLECFADGHSRSIITYSWKKIGGVISTRARFENENRVIVIEKAQTDDEGDYECTANQEPSGAAKGGSPSGRIKLSLNAVPYFVNPPMNQYVDLGKKVTMTCEATGKPGITFVWFRGNTALSNGGKYAITTQPSSSQLSITNIQVDDSDSYGCQISNTYGTSSAYAWIKVISFAPSFAKYPLENREGMVSQEFVYFCPAEGAPSPVKKWFKDGVALTTQAVQVDAMGKVTCPTTAKHCHLHNGNLMIAKLVTADTGNYTCEAKNALGTALSTGYLKVMNAPTWTLIPENRQIMINTTVDIPCLAESAAHLDINYNWKFESTVLKFDRLSLDARRYEKSQLLRPYGRNFGSLRIENVQFENEGSYECILNTPIGAETKRAWIRVAGPPGPCAGVQGETIANSSSVKVSWARGSSHHATITEYIIETAVIRPPASLNWTQQLVFKELSPLPVTNIDRRSTEVKGLAANTTYTVRVRAVNQFGIGEPSIKSNEFTTNAKPPVKVPQNVTGGGGRRQTLVVRWNPVPIEFYNGPNFKYIIQYQKTLGNEWSSKESIPASIPKVQGKYFQYTFTLPQGSPDYSPYYVRVGSKNDKGMGPYSNPVRIFSAEAVPTSTPNDVVAAAFNSTAMIVHWKKPIPNRGEGQIQGYRIVYWLRTTKCNSNNRGVKATIGMRQTVFGDFDQGYIIGLDIDAYYCIVVQVFNQAGDGPESGVTEQTTWKRAPSNFPTLVKLNSTGRPNEIQVSWVGIYTEPQEESLDGYTIRYWRTGAPSTEFVDEQVGLQTHGYLQSLQLDIRYNLRVYGYSRGGVGEMSSPMIQFTLMKASDCIPGTYDQPGIRFVFICSGCNLKMSFVFTLVCVISAVFSRLLQ